MSTKPTTLPRWSTDLSNATEPSSGQKDTGWTPGQDGISDYDNWVKYWNYKWAEYLNDGDLSLRDIVVSGTVRHTGTYSATLIADVADLNPGSNIYRVEYTPTASGWTLHGIQGGADGRELIIYNNISSGFNFYLEHDSATCVTVADRFYFPDTAKLVRSKLVMPPGSTVKIRWSTNATRWVVTEMCGVLVARGISIPAADATMSIYNGGSYQNNMTQLEVTGSISVSYPVPVVAGSIVDSYALTVTKNSVAPGVVTSQLYSHTTGTATTAHGASDTETANNPGVVVLTETSLGLSAVSGQAFYLKVDVTATGGSTDKLETLNVIAYMPV
jgi:hypothetical protein